jgi:hypothetical protein
LVTEAVRVTVVPAGTEEPEDKGPEFDDKASVVVVVVPAICHSGAATIAMIATIALRRIHRLRRRCSREDVSGRAKLFVRRI